MEHPFDPAAAARRHAVARKRLFDAFSSAFAGYEITARQSQLLQEARRLEVLEPTRHADDPNVGPDVVGQLDRGPAPWALVAVEVELALDKLQGRLLTVVGAGLAVADRTLCRWVDSLGRVEDGARPDRLKHQPRPLARLVSKLLRLVLKAEILLTQRERRLLRCKRLLLQCRDHLAQFRDLGRRSPERAPDPTDQVEQPRGGAKHGFEGAERIADIHAGDDIRPRNWRQGSRFRFRLHGSNGERR